MLSPRGSDRYHPRAAKGDRKLLETPTGIDGVTVQRRLAVGGMAELFIAEQATSQGPRTVVLKRALPGDENTARLAREREALSGVDSPHIVSLLGGDADWLLLEYVEGPDLGALLAHHVKRGRRLPVPAALAAIEGLARGLAALHDEDRKLVHRDVNPGNLLVRATDGAVKLADLGVVRVGAEAPTSAGGLRGTIGYMAPEQLSGKEADHRTDIYAAGLVAYELLTGVPARPSGAIGLAELLQARSALPTAPTALRPELPAALDAPILRALEPDPTRRPSHVLAWLEALLAAAGETPSKAALAALTEGVTGGPTLTSTLEKTAVDPPNTTVDTPGPAAALEAGPEASDETPAPPKPKRLLGLLPDPDNPTPDGLSHEEHWRLYRGPRYLLIAGLAAVLGTAWWANNRLMPPEDREVVIHERKQPPAPIAARAESPVAVETPPPTATPFTRVVRSPATAVTGQRSEIERTVESPPPEPAPKDPTKATPRIERPPKDPKAAAPAPAPVRVRVVGGGHGPVHVSGIGASGLAPKTTSELTEGGQVLRLVGGSPALRATVRLTRRGERLSVSIGAPSGKVYSVSCGGRVRDTPVVGLSLKRSLKCRVSEDGGGTLGFGLVRSE